jgi:hypothetical protein
MRIEEVLGKENSWHVWVIEYGITHSVMRVALHQGDYVQRTEVICGDVREFRGALQGGPYHLRLEADASGVIRLFDSDGRFELLCGRISLARAGN